MRLVHFCPIRARPELDVPRCHLGLLISLSRDKHSLQSPVSILDCTFSSDRCDGDQYGAWTPTASRIRSDDDVLEAKSRKALEDFPDQC